MLSFSNLFDQRNFSKVLETLARVNVSLPSPLWEAPVLLAASTCDTGTRIPLLSPWWFYSDYLNMKVTVIIHGNHASTHTLGFPGDSDSKASTCNVGDMSLTPRLGRYIHCAESENFIFTFLRFYFSMYIGVYKSSGLQICVIRSSSFHIVFLWDPCSWSLLGLVLIVLLGI